MAGKGPKDVSWELVNYPEDGDEVNHSHGIGQTWHTHIAGDEPHAHLHTKAFEDETRLVLRDEFILL